MEKLFHREKLPALEHNIIYTSWRTRVNQQNVIGEHFEVLKILYERPLRTCGFFANIPACLKVPRSQLTEHVLPAYAMQPREQATL